MRALVATLATELNRQDSSLCILIAFVRPVTGPKRSLCRAINKKSCDRQCLVEGINRGMNDLGEVMDDLEKFKTVLAENNLAGR